METRNSKSNLSKQKHWENHISSWRSSGLTQRQYCLKQGVAISTFSYWIRKFKKRSAKTNQPRFYPLTVKASSVPLETLTPRTGVRLSLCNDRFKIDLEKDFSATTLKRLVVTLETI